MNDDRVWEFERSLWTGDAVHYRESIDPECLMVLPQPPFVLAGEEATGAVANTPRWSSASFSDQRVSRPEEGLIIVAYGVVAEREDQPRYEAHCSSTYRRLAHDDWKVVQHQQTPKLAR